MRHKDKNSRSASKLIRLWGRHAVEAALLNPDRVIRRVWATRDAMATLDLPSSLPVTPSGPQDLANMVPQAPEHNRGTWAKSVEMATRKYVARAAGDVYVITGPVFEPSIAKSPSIGDGHVHVPTYLFKLVYDQQDNRAWAHWQENRKGEWAREPISYEELMTRTGVDFLPSLRHLTAGP